MTNYSLVIASIIIIVPILTQANGFYDSNNRYRGFYWFEKEIPKESKVHQLSPNEAVIAIEIRREELEDAKNQMIELSYREDVSDAVVRDAIHRYKIIEMKMYDAALRLSNGSDMLNFTNPELTNKYKSPTNIFANRIKRKLDAVREDSIIEEFATRYDLILFASDNCPYSQNFLPVVTSFANQYRFNLDITSLDSEAGRLSRSMNIDIVPSLVAISRDGRELFEINRGMNSLSEIKENIILADQYSKERRGK